MKKRGLLWGLPTIIWLLFTFWYTDFGGPMTQEEIARGMAVMKSRNYNPELLVQVEAFLQNDTGRQFLMVNNIDTTTNWLPW
ncbi:MAG: hypothetical protein OXC84_02470 [Gammaproteobacteria bacterium]|nr:hypothetical protein [Gammaproteobacteria bacterium]